MVKSAKMSFDTRGDTDIIDITEEVEARLNESRLEDGVATVFVAHSTAGIAAIENEPGLVKDFRAMFQRLAPRDIPYSHDSGLGEGNGFSHVRASLLGPSLAVPFSNGRLSLGTWQRVVLVDFDNRPRTRQVIVQFLGD